MKYRDDVCLSLGNIDFLKALSIVREAPLVELRLDLLTFSEEEYRALYHSENMVIATFRGSDPEAMEFHLSRAIGQGCRMVDVGTELPMKAKKRLLKSAFSHSCNWIASYHNYRETPESKELQRIYRRLTRFNPSYIKIATMCNKPDDLISLISLYSSPLKPIAFGMGEIGKVSRLLAPVLGAPFTFASIGGLETAPGQLSYETVASFLNTYLPKIV